MALDACNAEIAKALGKMESELSKREKQIIQRRASELKRKIDLANGDPAAISGVIQQYADEAALAAAQAKRSAALNYLAARRELDRFERVAPQVKNEGAILESVVRGSPSKFESSHDSAMMRATHESQRRSQAMIADFVKAGVDKFAVDPANNRVVGGALYDARNGLSEAQVEAKWGSLAAKTAAILENHREMLRLDFNRAGAFIGKNSDAIFRRGHDAVKIAAAGGKAAGSAEARANWVENVYGRMDWQRAFDGELANADEKERRAVLDLVWTDMSSNTHIGPDSGPPGMGTRNLGKRHSYQRQMVFKSAEDEVAYMEEFGAGRSIAEIVDSELRMGGRDYGLMSKLGPNPEATFDKIYHDRAETLRARKDSKGLASLTAAYNKMKKNDWNLLNNRAGMRSDNPVYRYLEAGRVWTSAAALQNSIWSLTGDMAIRAAQVAQSTGMSATKAFMDAWFRQIMPSGMSAAERAKVAANYAVHLEGLMTPLDPVTGGHVASDTASKFMRGVMKYGGHNTWVNRTRLNSVVADAHYYWQRAGSRYGELNAFERGQLEKYGIGEPHWDILRSQPGVQINDWGEKALTPDAIMEMEPERFRSIAGKDATEPQLVRARADLTDRFRNMLGETADRSTVSQSLELQARIGLGTQLANQGTALGFGYRTALALKGFMVNYVFKHLARELYGYTAEAKSVPEMLADVVVGRNSNAARGLGRLMTMGFLTFLAVDALKDMAMGKTPLDITDWDAQKHGSVFNTPGYQSFIKAFAKQATGIYGEVLLGDSGQPDQSLAESVPEKFVGPEAEFALRAGDSFLEYVHAIGKAGGPKQSDLNRANQHLFGLAWRQTPGTSLFWTKAAMDYYVYNQLAEALNPGYARRLDERMRKEGQTYLLPPP